MRHRYYIIFVGGDSVAISFKKLTAIFREKNITSYTIKKEKIISSGVYDKLTKQENPRVDTDTINNLCKYLGCQPGDIMEYVEEEEK